MKILSVVAAILIGLLALTACGGGGGGGGVAPGTAVSGVASKGIIRNGSIKIYALTADGSKGELLKETVTDGNGAYHAALGNYRGPILVEASGSYTDEATGAIMTVPADTPLRAAIDNLTGEVAVAVTPLTELAVQRNEDPLTHKLRVADIASSNALIASIFKTDIISTMPVDPLADSPTATQEQKEHALILAAFANLMQSKGEDLRAVIAELKDSIGTDNKLSISVAAQFQAALAEFASSPGNRTGITDISATPLINIGGTTRALTISVSGTPALIAGVELIVTLPPGVTVKAATNGNVLSTALQTSGGALADAIVAGNYTPPTASMRGRVRLAVISAKGFAAGEFVTLQCDVAPDATPQDTDFILSLLNAVDGQLKPLDGLSISAKLGQ